MSDRINITALDGDDLKASASDRHASIGVITDNAVLWVRAEWAEALRLGEWLVAEAKARGAVAPES